MHTPVTILLIAHLAASAINDGSAHLQSKGEEAYVSNFIDGDIRQTDQQKIELLRTMIGKRGAVTLTDSKAARDVRIVELKADSFGMLDSIVLRSGFWDENVPVSKISEINAGGALIVLESHPRRMLKLREINFSKAEREIEQHRLALDERSTYLDSKEQRLRDKKIELSAYEEDISNAIELNRREMEMKSQKIDKRERELKEDRDHLSAGIRALDTSKSDWERIRHTAETKLDSREKTVGEREALVTAKARALAEKETELLARASALAVAERELREELSHLKFLHGTVKTPDGKPLASVVVELRRGGRVIDEMPITDAGGVFQSDKTLMEDYLVHTADYKVLVRDHDVHAVAFLGGDRRTKPLAIIVKMD